METHTEISRQYPNLFSAEQVAKAIGADLETVNEWLDVGAVDRAVFGGGQFSRYELHRVALVFELVKFGFSPSCARDIIREMEYDLQLVWTRIPSDFKAYAIIIPAGRKWLVSWCWKRSSDQIDSLPMKGHIVLPVSDTLTRITNETKRVGFTLSDKSCCFTSRCCHECAQIQDRRAVVSCVLRWLGLVEGSVCRGQEIAKAQRRI